MKLYSIIIATYNSGSRLEKALQSVICQNTKDTYELIVVDGGSTDNTVEIIKEYSKYISFWTSEKDKGIYDAWNKGISKSTGEWIMFLGSDDILLPNALEHYRNFLKLCPASGNLDYVSSLVSIVDSKGKRLWINGESWKWPNFLRKMIVAHPGSMHSRKLYDEYGIYNLNYKVVGDYELLLRPKERLKSGFLNVITVEMTEGGTSDSLDAVIEHYHASTKTGNANKLLTLLFCFYVFVKSRANRNLRRFGINFNRKSNELY